MNEENKPSRAKRSAAKNMEDKLHSKTDDNKSEELIDRILDAQRLSEERMLAIFHSNQDQLSKAQQHLSSALEALQSQSARKTEQDQLLKILEESQRRPLREKDIVIEPVVIFDRRHINRHTDRLFAYCESSYIYFKEEPIAIDEGPGHHKPLPPY
jgi:3-hydroxyacyl-CoA dehydrogenase